MAVVTFDDGLRKHTDNTTSATYTYLYSSWDANATTSQAKWLCKRIHNADGTWSYADGISDFSDRNQLITVAQGLTATYAG